MIKNACRSGHELVVTLPCKYPGRKSCRQALQRGRYVIENSVPALVHEETSRYRRRVAERMKEMQTAEVLHPQSLIFPARYLSLKAVGDDGQAATLPPCPEPNRTMFTTLAPITVPALQTTTTGVTSCSSTVILSTTVAGTSSGAQTAMTSSSVAAASSAGTTLPSVGTSAAAQTSTTSRTGGTGTAQSTIASNPANPTTRTISTQTVLVQEVVLRRRHHRIRQFHQKFPRQVLGPPWEHQDVWDKMKGKEDGEHIMRLLYANIPTSKAFCSTLAPACYENYAARTRNITEATICLECTACMTAGNVIQHNFLLDKGVVDAFLRFLRSSLFHNTCAELCLVWQPLNLTLFPNGFTYEGCMDFMDDRYADVINIATVLLRPERFCSLVSSVSVRKNNVSYFFTAIHEIGRVFHATPILRNVNNYLLTLTINLSIND
ncbi:hypothetical protein NECAME_05820 [Necator americanus]|uniref:Uncharacterized protein n=1 Tax=Necator americanus TaxID=51031 RepID=W2TYB0_NECAM|nr:hypothetical protein NECAME_05820 [Necator americanus]ETN86828.1 hypothetical protein NECAME_05820 [Necator americanus]